MDSLDSVEDEKDLSDAEVEAELEKLAVPKKVDSAQKQHEFELWKQWKATPTPQTFEPLYAAHQNIIQKLTGREFGSTTLPPAAMRSHVLRSYVNAVETYEPGKSALTTHVWNNIRHARLGRLQARYQDIGKIPEERRGLINLLENREAALLEQLGRLPSAIELSDDMLLSVQDIDELKKTKPKITPRVVTTLRREIRKDLLAEQPGGEMTPNTSSELQDRITFLHGSVPPEQQLVIEHTFEGWGKPVIQDINQLSKVLKMSPQKIRSIKAKIAKQVDQYYGMNAGTGLNQESEEADDDGV